jgi:acetyl-CoA synthetase
MQPGSCCSPFFGVEPVILDAHTGTELTGNNVEGVLAIKRSWPSIVSYTTNN